MQPVRVTTVVGATRFTTILAMVVGASFSPLFTQEAQAATSTVVSLTFNDGNSSQYTYGRPVLQTKGLNATFYVASGWVDAGSNSSMAWYQLRDLYRDGDEIGGMGKDHKSLTDTTTDNTYKTAQVCDDKARLAAMGLDPQTFAYPQAAVDANAKSIVAGCRYIGGRTIGGVSPTSSPYAEAIPPADPYNLRTANLPSTAISLTALQTAVNAAASHGGGWLPVSFNQVCHQGSSNYSTCMASSKPIDDVVLGQFLDWLKATGQTGGAPTGTTVKTVRNVLGAPPPPILPPDPTTVSLTFNDGNASQYTYARPILNSQHLNASFYLPTNWLDKSFAATMPWWQVDNLYRDGNEIGGMGRDHKDLTDTSTDTAYKTAQVCNDRQRLLQQGYDPMTFDYPLGAYNAAAQTIVKGCGYAAARASGGLSTSGPTYAESLPPKDTYAIRTPSTTNTGAITLTELENSVTAAATHGGGWVPFVFTQVCDQASSDYSTCMASYRPIDDTVLSQFAVWLANAGQTGGAPAGVSVKTVRDALGLPAEPPLPTRPLAVSLTFDDGDASQYPTLDMLQQHGLHGTYYINTAAGHMGMTWTQLHALADAGNDVGGHTLTHIDLTSTSYTYDQKYHEVCDNRQDLISNGFNPVSFAYPFGSYDSTATGLAQICGYQSARRAGGLVVTGPTYAETVPPANADVVRTAYREATTPLQLSDLTDAVQAAASHGGGWLPLVFHEICYQGDPGYSDCMNSFKPTDSTVFNSFLDWLQNNAPAGTSVKTMTEVMGGGNTVPVVNVTAPSVGQLVGSTPTYSGTAASDGADVKLTVYSGSYPAGTPVTTLTAPVTSGAWTVTAPSALADGTYTLTAQQNRSGLVGQSVPRTFQVGAP